MRKKIILSIGLLLVTFCLKAQEDSTYQKYIGFVEKLAFHLSQRDTVFFQKNFDHQLLANVYEKIAPHESKEDLIVMNKVLEKVGSMYHKRVYQNLGQHGSIDIVQFYLDKQHRGHAVFRLLYPSGDLNYHTILLRKIQHQIKIVNIYNFSTAEYLTETYQRHSYAAAYEGNYRANFFTSLKANALAKAGQAQAGYDSLQTLPAKFRNNCGVLFGFLKALSFAGKKSEKVFFKVQKQFASRFPNNPSLLFLKIYYYHELGYFDQALESIQNLQKKLGGDPYLDIYQASLYYAKKDYNQAILICQQLIKDGKHLPDAFFQLLRVYQDQKKHKLVLQNLLEYAALISVKPAKALDATQFSSFYASQVWQDYQAKQEKD